MKTSLYIHIPYCLSKCEYCDFFSVKCSQIDDFYVRSLCNEIEAKAKFFNVTQWNSIYIGGGTPSLLNKEQLKQIFNSIYKFVPQSKNSEITIEVNPDDVTEALIQTFEECGINRISCGIQSLNQKSLAFTKRRASLEQNLNALALIQKKWNGIFSVDLICGLPYETEKSFLDALEQIVLFNPHHISMYSLVVEEETPLGQKILNEKIPYDYDFADNLWLNAREFLQNNGFIQYEVSNFCKKGFECSHNLVYWNHQDYIGCGSGAVGTIYDSDGSGKRFFNLWNIDEYKKYWLEHLQYDLCKKNIEEIEVIDKETSEFEFFMMGLRKLIGINSCDYKKIFSKEIPITVKNQFVKWQKNGFAKITKQGENEIFSLTQKGILFLNKFMEELEL